MRSFALRSKETRALAVLSVIVILSLFSGPNRTPVAAQKLTVNEFSTHSLSNSLLTIPDDIMPPISAVQTDQATMSAVTSDYQVIPILFVPNQRTPNPFGLQGIDRTMQSVQRWYGEQLRDRSFSLEPARIVVGTHPLSYYYGSCYPSTSFCHWATFLHGNQDTGRRSTRRTE